MPPSTHEVRRHAYYDCALALLRVVEARSPTARRFGPEADALWRSVAGDLDLGDRLELLLRDADRQWGAAFGARAVFALRSAHEQDAFGADWRRLSAREAEALWNQAATAKPSADPLAAVDQILATWRLEPQPCQLPKLGPSSRLVVAGLGALVATLRAFLANADLSWPNQVVVIADEPGPRQLAAAAAALADHAEATVLLGSDQVTPEQTKRLRAKFGAGLEPVISADASAPERDAAARLAPSKPS